MGISSNASINPFPAKFALERAYAAGTARTIAMIVEIVAVLIDNDIAKITSSENIASIRDLGLVKRHEENMMITTNSEANIRHPLIIALKKFK
ncbi:MAG: hypothetical protein QXZ49_01765 [Nitrososphaerota archaeon]